MITLDELLKIMPTVRKARGELFLPYLNETMEEFEIDVSADREAAFLAQVAHESGSLRYTEEIASGDAYEGRADLGNTQPGDGRRFKGRGLIQLTGRANYEDYAQYKGMGIDEVTAYLKEPDGATNVAGWFWQTKKLNMLADSKNFRLITKVINGGYNGWDDRLAYYQRAIEVLA